MKIGTERVAANNGNSKLGPVGKGERTSWRLESKKPINLRGLHHRPLAATQSRASAVVRDG